MRSPREVLVADRSGDPRFHFQVSERNFISARELAGGMAVVAALASASGCGPGEQFLTPTPQEGQTIQIDRGQVRVLSLGEAGLTQQEDNILSAYKASFENNWFIKEAGYTFDNLNVVQVAGVNNKGDNSTLEMAIASALIDARGTKGYFFQFRDDNKTPQPGEVDSSVTTYIYTESEANVKMRETKEGVVIDIYGLEIKPKEQQEGQSPTYVKFYSLLFDSSSPHSTLAELLEKGTLLQSTIINPVSLKSAVIDETKTPAPTVAEGDAAIPVSFVLRQEQVGGVVPTVEPTTIITPTEVSVTLSSLLSADVLGQLNTQTENKADRFFTVEGNKLFITIDGKQLEVNPSTSGVNIDKNGNVINNKNDLYGSIVTIKGADGKYYAFNPDYSNGWFEVIEASSDVVNPTEVSDTEFYDGRVLTSLLLDSEVNTPFPEGTVYTGISMNGDDYQKPGWAAYLRQRSAQDPAVPTSALPSQWVDRYFKVAVNGSDFYFNPAKWLDTDANNPDLAQFKLLFLTFGSESKGNAFDYQKFLANLDPEDRMLLFPIIAADPDFFDKFKLDGFGATQPSLAQLYELEGNNPGEMDFFKGAIDYMNTTYGVENPWEVLYSMVDDPRSTPLPPEIQKMLLAFYYSVKGQ